VLLERAARSIGQQSFRDFVWIVVNDGGDEAAARQSVTRSDLPAKQILFMSNAESVGMEAAANQGVRGTSSNLIAIHDDDDTWHPDFLARTSAVLAGPRGAGYGGVVTTADYVSEEIRHGSIIEHGRNPYNRDLRTVQLAEMLVRNLFPPISFLFRRSIWEKAGGFNERLPVLGDWYFNIRFLLEADIAVLPERLASWHHRDRGGKPAYANSVIGSADLHEEYNAVVRNALVRDLASKPGTSLAPLLGFMLEDVRRQIAGVKRSIGSETTASIALDPAGREGGTLEALAAMSDLADRRWIVAQLPLRARLRLSMGSTASRRDPTWSELLPHLKTARLTSPSDFDEAAYLSANRDVASGVSDGRFANGYEHYIRHGRLEGRVRPLRLP